MRVALLSYNAQIHSAVGNQIAERLAFFAERGDEARLFVQSGERLHPQVADRAHVVAQPRASGPAWDLRLMASHSAHCQRAETFCLCIICTVCQPRYCSQP